MESDTAEGPVVKIVRVLLAPNMGKCNDRLTAGLCTFRVIDGGKSETRLPSSRDHGLLDFFWMVRARREQQRTQKIESH